MTVAKGTTTTAITAHTPDPSIIGFPVIVEFSVTASGVTPTGSVTVGDGEVSCEATVLEASCTLTFTTIATTTLTATYSGDTNLEGSTSPGVVHTVIDFYRTYLPVVIRNYP